MFEDLPLDEFGNRIPPITAEIAWAGAPQAVVKDTTFLSGAGYFTSSAVLDSERGFLYFKTSPDGIGRIRTSGMVEDLRVPATELGIDLAGVKAIDSRGDLYVTHGITEQSFRKIDGDTLQVVASASFSSQVELATVSAYTLTGRIDFVLALGFLSAPARIFFADDLSVFWQGQNVSTRPGGVVGGLSDFGACEAWFAAYPSIVLGDPTATVSILHVRMELPFTVSPVTGFPATVKPNLITLAASAFGAAELTIAQLCYDEQNDRLLFISSLDGVRHLVSYSAASGIVWYVPVSGDLPHQARFTDGKIRLVSGTNVITRSADDGSLISSQSGFTGTSGIVRFDARTGALYTPTSGSGIEQWLPGRSSDDSALLGDVVTALCERVGLTAADLDVTELTDEVHGFGIARQISVRGALEMLAAAYTFDAVESDHQLKFKKRGRSPSRVIAGAGPRPRQCRARGVHRDAGPGGRPAAPLHRGLPGPRARRRHRHPVRQAGGGAEQRHALAQRGDLRSAPHAHRRGGQGHRAPAAAQRLARAHRLRVAPALDPCRPRARGRRAGRARRRHALECAHPRDRARRQSRARLEDRARGELELHGHRGAGRRPELSAAGRPGQLRGQAVPAGCAPDPGQRRRRARRDRALLGGWPPTSTRPGAARSCSRATMVPCTWRPTRRSMRWPGASPGRRCPTPICRSRPILTSQLHLTMVSGSLASVSNLEMLNGANLAALIRADGNAELIQFQDIALSEGVYTLTTLLRGRRGTEVFTGGHAVGDLFVLLDGDGVTRRPLGLDRLGDTLHYRAVGRGGELRDARTAQLTLAGNDLKPYAPAQLEATGSWGSNVTLSWQRRTRVGGELIDGSGEVPLAEDSEQYDLEILFGNAVVRVVRRPDQPELRLHVRRSGDRLPRVCRARALEPRIRDR